MTDYAGRLIAHNLELHLEPVRALIVGDIVEVVRGNGPREGEHMGTATVIGFDHHGSPELSVKLDTFSGEV